MCVRINFMLPSLFICANSVQHKSFFDLSLSVYNEPGRTWMNTKEKKERPVGRRTNLRRGNCLFLFRLSFAGAFGEQSVSRCRG